jgi:hypothetical protein
MGKPTKEELETALSEAARMREHGDDPCFLAKSLLNQHYLNKHLEKVLHAAELYLRSGQGATEHTRLLHAINEYRLAERRSSGEDAEKSDLT